MEKYIYLITLSFFSCTTPTPKKCPDIVYKNNLTLLNDEVYSGRCAVYQNDTLSSIQQYVNGRDHGKWKFFFSSGDIETLGKFKNGKRVGKWRYYYSNGKKKQISKYKNGEKSGNWLFYDENGKLVIAKGKNAKYDSKIATDRVLRALSEKKVTNTIGKDIDVGCDTICIHSDTPNAVEIIQGIRTALGK